MGSTRVTVKDDEVRVGRRFAVTFQRTLRIPDDGRTYPLPPGLGRLPVLRVADYRSRVPDAWRRRGGVIIPLYQREALWLAFDAADWKPNAVQAAAGGVNAVSGGAWAEGLADDPQNYVVCPEQLWLDGINAGGGVVRQFVAMPLGAGYTVEAQLTGREDVGGLQVRVYEPKPGRFPERAPRGARSGTLDAGMVFAPRAAGAMGLGAGGRTRQKIYPDPHGLDTWDADNYAEVFVHIVNSEQYHELTGRPAPPTPVSARTYTERGFPWFDLYDEGRGTVAASERLSKARSIRELDAAGKRAGVDGGDRPVKIDPSRVKKIKRT